MCTAFVHDDEKVRSSVYSIDAVWIWNWNWNWNWKLDSIYVQYTLLYRHVYSLLDTVSYVYFIISIFLFVNEMSTNITSHSILLPSSLSLSQEEKDTAPPLMIKMLTQIRKNSHCPMRETKMTFLADFPTCTLNATRFSSPNANPIGPLLPSRFPTTYPSKKVDS